LKESIFFIFYDYIYIYIFRTLAIIKPDAIRNLGDIISAVYENGFTIARMRMVKLSQNEVMYFYSEHKAKDFFPYVF
jgi:nucleoside diphosphate kinase